ncbi:Hsp20/alpha crystallin family protein [Komagataeibacter sp. FNDCR2]|uniref:Hsp20/alpha crystallin family protein n=1 Tax=Komagataeibacter sp. FNDCR2 TaxID=2878682 RepID=UPI001E5C6484|nr:Hsp20/alpha crystallin family protein [Komagataeibacter sp. FNDCR2]MCE2575224.1 Hsp20/alpha crystallin family protein [Komagataeibacter sp. FNDCR2]
MTDVNRIPPKTETETATTAAPSPSRPVFDTLRRELDRVFEDFPSTLWRRPISGFERLWSPREAAFNIVPAIDVVEKDTAYTLVAELPGMDEKNIELKVSGNVLSIRGEKCEESTEEQKNYHYSERRFGSFMRSFPIPEGVDTAKIDASFSNGLLTVSLPKTPEAQKDEKIIPVRPAQAKEE